MFKTYPLPDRFSAHFRDLSRKSPQPIPSSNHKQPVSDTSTPLPTYLLDPSSAEQLSGIVALFPSAEQTPRLCKNGSSNPIINAGDRDG